MRQTQRCWRSMRYFHRHNEAFIPNRPSPLSSAVAGATAVFGLSAALVDPCKSRRWVSSPVGRLFNLHVVQSPISLKRPLKAASAFRRKCFTHTKHTTNTHNLEMIRLASRGWRVNLHGKNTKCKVILWSYGNISLAEAKNICFLIFFISFTLVECWNVICFLIICCLLVFSV